MREECVEVLRRGQVPPPDLLVTEVAVELVYNGFKYPLVAQRSGPNSFILSMPGSPNNIEVVSPQTPNPCSLSPICSLSQ
jgi:hypothetical protein